MHLKLTKTIHNLNYWKTLITNSLPPILEKHVIKRLSPISILPPISLLRQHTISLCIRKLQRKDHTHPIMHPSNLILSHSRNRKYNSITDCIHHITKQFRYILPSPSRKHNRYICLYKRLFHVLYIVNNHVHHKHREKRNAHIAYSCYSFDWPVPQRKVVCIPIGYTDDAATSWPTISVL